MAREVSASSRAEWKHHVQLRNDREEQANVRVAALRIMERLALRHLGVIISTNGEGILVGQQLQRLHASLTARVLLATMKREHRLQVSAVCWLFGCASMRLR